MPWIGNYPGVETWPVPNGWASDRQGTRIDTIIVHVMVGSYEGSMYWAQTNPNRTSFHYGIAQDGRIGQAVDEKWGAHHAGVFSWNLRSLSLEHEDKGNAERAPWMTEKMFAASTRLAAHLCKKYGVSPERIIPHRQVASDGRTCPGPYFDLVGYRDHVKRLLSPSPPPAAPVLYRVVAGTFKARTGARSRVAELVGKGFEAAMVFEYGYFRVLAGTFKSRTGADARIRELKAKGLEAYALPTVAKPPKPRPAVVAPPASTRRWADKTRRVAEEIEQRFNVACSTYHGHGTTGEAYGIDAWVSPLGVRANKEQEALGDAIQKFVEANWARLGIDYLIWWGWINFGSGWRQYDPSSYNNPLAAKNSVTELHYDHVHLQVRR